MTIDRTWSWTFTTLQSSESFLECRLWHTEFSHHCFAMPTATIRLPVQLLASPQFLGMILGSGRWWPYWLDPCHPHGRLGWSSCPGYCSHLGSDRLYGKSFSLCLSISLSLLLCPQVYGGKYVNMRKDVKNFLPAWGCETTFFFLLWDCWGPSSSASEPAKEALPQHALFLVFPDSAKGDIRELCSKKSDSITKSGSPLRFIQKAILPSDIPVDHSPAFSQFIWNSFPDLLKLKCLKDREGDCPRFHKKSTGTVG